MGGYLRLGLASGIVTSLLVSLVLTLYLRPTAQIPLYEEFAIIAAVNMVGYATGLGLAFGSRLLAFVIKAIVTPAILALVVIAILKPVVEPGYEMLFLGLFGIEVAGILFVTTLAMLKPGRRSQPAPKPPVV